MASRISQIRNGIPQQFPIQQTQQQQLDESIERTRLIMQQFKNMPNMETAIMNLLSQNPQLSFLSNMLHNGNSLENIAKQIAIEKGADINEVINKLQSNR